MPRNFRVVRPVHRRRAIDHGPRRAGHLLRGVGRPAAGRAGHRCCHGIGAVTAEQIIDDILLEQDRSERAGEIAEHRCKAVIEARMHDDGNRLGGGQRDRLQRSAVVKMSSSQCGCRKAKYCRDCRPRSSRSPAQRQCVLEGRRVPMTKSPKCGATGAMPVKARQSSRSFMMRPVPRGGPSAWPPDSPCSSPGRCRSGRRDGRPCPAPARSPPTPGGSCRDRESRSGHAS